MKKEKLSLIAIALAILYSLVLIRFAVAQPPKQVHSLQYPELQYDERIFDPSYVHIIDIQVSTLDWNGLKKHALSKECIDSTVTIDGEDIHHVGVRTKGKSTLLFNAAKGWDRFSLVLEFDAFQESQRYYGLDCLSLYNNMFDASCIRKLTSRKFWIAVVGFITPLLLAFGVTEDSVTQVTIIMAGADVVAYLIAEGMADSAGNT